MGREIYNIIYDMEEALIASQMQKLQEVLVKLLIIYLRGQYRITVDREYQEVFLKR